MNRRGFQKLALIRLEEANVLLNNKMYHGAYYLCGYSVECALKACIAKQIKRHDIPDKEFINKFYTHDLNRLIDLAGLKIEHANEMENNIIFAANWGYLKDWSEKTRYALKINKREAASALRALTEINNGIISWLKNYW